LGAVSTDFDSAAPGISASSTQPQKLVATRSLIVAGYAGVIGLATVLFFFHLGTYGL